MYIPVPGFEPMSTLFLGEFATHKATVPDVFTLKDVL